MTETKPSRIAKSLYSPTLAQYLQKEDVQRRLLESMSLQAKQRFCASLINRVNNNPMLKDCTNQSIVSAAIIGEVLRLSPSSELGQYHLVPYKNKQKGTVEAAFQLGYKGYIQLAIRSGQYKTLNAIEIKEGELKYFDPIEERIHLDFSIDYASREKSKTIGYYGSFELVNGFRKAIYWTHDKMLAHAKQYSKSFESEYNSFWKKEFDAMALKTILRTLISKWGVLDDQVTQAIEAENTNLQEFGYQTPAADVQEVEAVKELPKEPEVPLKAKEGFDEFFE